MSDGKRAGRDNAVAGASSSYIPSGTGPSFETDRKGDASERHRTNPGSLPRDRSDGELLPREQLDRLLPTYCRPITCLDTLEVIEVAPTRVSARAALTLAGTNGAGFAHGGWLFSLCDVCTGLPALARGKASVTQDASISYLNPGRVGTVVHVDVEVLRRGGRSIVSQVRLRDGDANGTLLATGIFTHVIVGDIP